MTLFGRTLGFEEIGALVFMLMALVLWTISMRNELAWTRWFRNWEAERKARRDAELAAENPDKPSDTPRGPWG
ncbi:hypothetical protein [Brevundimonas sp. GCM10030266]|uniref:hypothetical protein n=1 Tax=Brevundimonas sp. GCM10030266 TaxID=3273386 RepID=UPI00361A3A17